METPGGTWAVRDAYRVEGDLLRGVRRFEWRGKEPARRATLSVRFRVPGAKDPQAVLPGILYNGNPSGARSGRVPVYGGRPGEEALFEEHRSCGQLIDPYGSQGEQPQHTNYTQAGAAADPRRLRGGYNETWTVFWITAHFLNAAARFREMGVDLDA